MTRCGPGSGATTVYNAANEVAVAAFIAGKIKFGAHRPAGRGDHERLDSRPGIWRR